MTEQKEIKSTDSPDPAVSVPWAKSWEETVEELDVSPEEGLSQDEASRRLEKYGPNAIKSRPKRSMWDIFVDQAANLVVLLLAGAAIISFVFGQWLESAAISVAIGINILIGFFTELKAVRSMEALKEMSRVTVKVRRGGSLEEIPSEDVVPGDVVMLEGGDVIPADLRLLEAANLQLDESALTGESVPVTKQVEPVEEDAPQAERFDMAFNGTAVTGGSGYGVVVATGMASQLGRISELAEEAQAEEETPLERRLDKLANGLIKVTLLVAAAVAATGIIAGMDTFLIIETSIALAVAAIPEGLPIVATIALAHGMYRMARNNALVNRLEAVETLGSVTAVFTDKTGTLTENEMRVSAIALYGDDESAIQDIKADTREEAESVFSVDGRPVDAEDGSILREAVETGVLCNNAEAPNEDDEDSTGVGDPMELALLEVGRRVGMDRMVLLESLPEEKEVAFDAATMMMATIHRTGDSFRYAIKGAPEAVLESCSTIRTPDGEIEFTEEMRSAWRDHNTEMAEDGLRVLGLGTKKADSAEEEPYKNLTFLGLAGLLDPPRSGVKDSIDRLKGAGIGVIMVTGDQQATARTIAASLGLSRDEGRDAISGRELEEIAELSDDREMEVRRANIFTRVSPEQKLRLVELYKKGGAIVAMTGDGVNDAPGLQKADVGVAMGRRGTQVAREAADVVLQDDAFETIVAAVEQGRAIFNNIRRFIMFLLSGNVGEIMIVAFALVVSAPLPLLPLQILYLNMIGDVFPALALGLGEADPAIMRRPPRDPSEPILTRFHWWGIGAYGLLIAASVLTAFALAFKVYGMETKEAVTVSFLTLSFARLWHVFNMKSWGSGVIRNEVTRNPFVWGALVICVGLLAAAVWIPYLAMVLRIVPPDTNGWTLIGVFSVIPFIVVQIIKSPLAVGLVRKIRGRDRNTREQ